jgi:GTP pyrophosphokinase
MIGFDDLAVILPPAWSAMEHELIRRAYAVAEQAHAGQARASGEPYITHCLTVARELAELHMPPEVVAAGLLHDTVEDCYAKLLDLERAFGAAVTRAADAEAEITQKIERLRKEGKANPSRATQEIEKNLHRQMFGFIKHEFGAEVAQLVEGVSKLTQLPRVSKDGDTAADRNVENLRKLMLALNEDLRVVIIKLADRLHNMRTLHYVKPEKQGRIARETLEIFAPLANRMGIWRLKSELEDLSFQYLYPAKYHDIVAHLEEDRLERERVMAAIIVQVREALAQHGLTARLSGRPKHIYSIFKKMERKGVRFDEVRDVRAVRVILPDPPLLPDKKRDKKQESAACYAALGVIHSVWRPVPGEFDDYVNASKPNGYQSLHTAVIFDDGKTLEVQIRTETMHEQAEIGMAAHWQYKEGGHRHKQEYLQQINMMRSVLKDLRHTEAGDFLDALKSNLFQDRVYVFTPKGDIIDLPAGSTPIDFAYHVHTSVGDRCRGAKANGRIVNLDYQLEMGDKVEILTTKQGGPSRDWLNPELGLVKSHRAQQKIRNWFRKQDRASLIITGREELEKLLRRLGLEGMRHEDVSQLVGGPRRIEDFYVAVATDDISIVAISGRLLEEEKNTEAVAAEEPVIQLTPPAAVSTSDTIAVLGLSGMLTTLAQCCKPVPDDPIMGYITRGRGATVHRQDCPNMLRLRQKEPERCVQVTWPRSADDQARSEPVQKTNGKTETLPTSAERARPRYSASIILRAYDRDRLVQDVTGVVADESLSMSALHASAHNSYAVVQATVETTDAQKLARVLSRLEKLPNVIEVRRQKG